MLATILDNNVTVYQNASMSASPLKAFAAGDQVELGQVIKKKDQEWVEVWDRTGQQGYILAQTRVKLRPNVLRQQARKNMLHGAMWCIGGIVLTTASMNAAGPGGTYFIFWGAILFGGIQFLQGCGQFLRSLA